MVKIFEYIDFGQKFKKSRFCEKISNNLDFAHIFNNLEFFQNLKKYISILPQIYEKSWFYPEY